MAATQQHSETTTQREALSVLAAHYRDQIERAAEKLEAGFRSGELRGFLSGPDSEIGWEETPMAQLEERVSRILRLDSDVSALLTVLCSPNARTIGESRDNVHGEAMRAAAFDVLRIARERGWYVPIRGEDPEELRAFPRRRS